jgi:phosphoglycolate phosphatase-like HAD superfamily hydrolase
MDVIICDIDGTVLDVSDRIAAVLMEIGIDPSEKPSRVADTLQPPHRSRFYDLFLSEKYAHLDKPVPEVVAYLRDLQLSAGLPVVFLSARPDAMKRSTLAAIKALDVPYKEVVLRPWSQRFRKTTEFKVDAVQKRGYAPKHILDDDADILSALAAAFPGATMHRVQGSQTTPWPD